MPLRTGGKGVFCMPVLPNYYASHQWLRELKRRQATMVAVDFRLPADEMVLVGHYSAPHAEVSISEAARIIMSAQDPLGYEILLPRSVESGEIHKVRSVAQVIGWRYSPKAKGQRPFCTCMFCVRGDYGANKLRKRFGTPDRQPLSKQQVLEILRKGDDPGKMCDVLYNCLGGKRRNNPEELEFLLESPSVEVQEALAFGLRFYRGKRAFSMLLRLSQHESEQVRLEARESLVESGREIAEH
ncbi:MAG: HEAT repeat domain-containing protein [Candidatus Obscuribacterales bacterium]